MRNRSVYPITANLEDELSQFLDVPAVQLIIETVGEYEHGTADVEDLVQQEPINLKQYAAVALDLALVIGGQSKPAVDHAKPIGEV
jgi:hypothetical protein